MTAACQSNAGRKIFEAEKKRFRNEAVSIVRNSFEMSLRLRGKGKGGRRGGESEQRIAEKERRRKREGYGREIERAERAM